MPKDDSDEKVAGLGQAELDALRPTLARMARVAKTMFGAPLADVCLFRGESVWRAGFTSEHDVRDPASDLVRKSDTVMWIEDLTRDRRFMAHPAVTGVPHLRFYAGAPIALETGETIGALAVYGLKTRTRDARLVDRLRDLADVVGHECDRILAQAERNALLERVKRQEERLEVAVLSAGLHVFEMDFAERSLIKSGIEDNFYEKTVTFADLASGAYEHVHEDDRARVAAHSMRHMQSGELHPIEWRVNRTDGQEIWVNASAKMFRDEAGRPLRLIGSLQNVTDRKMGEKALAEAKAFAEAANLAKSVFLATMSHEIRTPLNGVMGMAQAMAQDELSAPQRERLDIVQQSGEALLAILNDLLDFSKIEAGKLELEDIPFDLAEIASGAHGAFSALAQQKGVAFNLSIGPALGMYRGDPTRVRQILYNLISNALKFTDEGEIRVEGGYDGETLTLTVCDTGIGMSADTVQGLFAKFSQADVSTTRKFGGTGLGLAICKELAALMGGKIAVESTLGEGSAFTVSLPLERLGEAGKAAPSAPQAAPAAANIRVLAAEDNSINQLVLKALLSTVGIEPVVVENGAAAVEAFEKDEYDLVLMDVQMPVMDGPTAVRAIRAFEGANGRARTPIIALTANAMSHQVAEYLACGMDGHLAKPIEAAKLFEVLGQALAPTSDCSEQGTADDVALRA